MKRSSLMLALAFGVLMADPAMAQSRLKDDSRRTRPRESVTTTDRTERRERDHETARPQPIRQNVTAPRPRDDDRRRYDDRDLWDRGVIILDPRGYGYLPVYGSGYSYGSVYGYGSGYGYGSIRGHGYSSGRVWNRYGDMSCLRLDDELEWAHHEWHYRNNRSHDATWYDEEHARLEWRIADERARSGCGRARTDRDCDERGYYALPEETTLIALEVLDILLGYGRWHGRN